jgi:RNA polymerase sigma-70 factor (ECF subfamily)
MSVQLQVELEIRAACDAGDHRRAVTLALESYGPELRAFLIARLRRERDADEVFAVMAEKAWLGLAQFEWRATLQSWLYRLARNAANDFSTSPSKRPARNLALEDHEHVTALVARVRSATPAYRKTAVKDQMRALREQLPHDDQMLLILRVDRQMDFRDLACALADESEPLDGAGLDREAARLRKRFERVKERLRAMAKDAGLI